MDLPNSGLLGKRCHRGIPSGKPLETWTRRLPPVILATSMLGILLYVLAELVEMSWGAWAVYLDRMAPFVPGDHTTSMTLLLVSLALCLSGVVLTRVGKRKGRFVLVAGLLVSATALVNVLWADDVWNLGLSFGLLPLLLSLSWIALLSLLVQPSRCLRRGRRVALLASIGAFVVLSGSVLLLGLPGPGSESDEDGTGVLHDMVYFFRQRIGTYGGLCLLLFLVVSVAGSCLEGGHDDADGWRLPMGLGAFFVAFMIAVGLGLESYYRLFAPAYRTPFTSFAILLAGGMLLCLSLLCSLYKARRGRLKSPSWTRWGGAMLVSLAVSAIGIGLVLLDDVVRARNPISTNPLPRWVSPYSTIMVVSALSFFCAGALLLVLGWKLWDQLSLAWRRPSKVLAPLVLVVSLPAALFAASLVVQQVSEVAMRLEWGFEALPEAWLFSPVTYRILWRTGLRWTGVTVASILGILATLLTIPAVAQIKH